MDPVPPEVEVLDINASLAQEFEGLAAPNLIQRIADGPFLRFRGILELLPKNYGTEVSSDRIRYRSRAPGVCPNLASPAAAVFEIQLRRSQTSEGYTDEIAYSSCGSPLFSEIWEIKGDSLTPRAPQDVLRVPKWVFPLQPGETSRGYTLRSKEEGILFRVFNIKESADLIRVRFEVIRTRILSMVLQGPNKETILWKDPYSLEWSRRGQGLRSNDSARERMRIVYDQDSARVYTEGSNRFPISLVQFSKNFSSYFNSVEGVVGAMMNSYLQDFPPVSAVQRDVKGTRLAREIEEAIIRVLGKQNLDLVQAFLMDLLKSFQDGLIDDRRP